MIIILCEGQTEERFIKEIVVPAYPMLYIVPKIIMTKGGTKGEYIQLLSKYELAVGQAIAGEPLLPNKELLVNLVKFCEESWKQSLDLVEAAKSTQLRTN
ncbi:hypothetical protein [Candidatus Marithrix sp. Canyon 246]|uniref:hypothetical protein n=1 Tax=Candidatus Marithrix sp. Canyon 246 TaxID=1827136 RepID=UPI00084A1AFF|nr:hypothetical protein [Candidatus Marithrix sp. Canyon 246]